MTRARLYVTVLAGVTLASLLLTGAAGAAPSDRYSASVSPVAVQPSATASYAIMLHNQGNSSDSADRGEITIPSGFSVNALTLAFVSGGGCPAATWSASIDPIDTSKIDLSPLNPGAVLCNGGTLTVAFEATSAPTEGTYTWTTELFAGTTAFDLIGGQPETTVDGTPPPVPVISLGPNDPTNQTSASFTFSDSESGVTFVCRVDGANGGSFTSCTSPATYSGLTPNASHTFDVAAVDAAGNSSAPSTPYSWTIDTEPPPVPMIDPHATVVGTSTTSFTFSSPGATTFQCQVDGAAFSACVSGDTVGPFPDGPHTFFVRALDGVSNASDPASSAWTIDTVNPVVTLSDMPPALSNQTAASFSFSSNKGGSTECKLDGGAFAGCTSPTLYNGLPDGSHTFAVRATSLGNTGPATTYIWTIDTVAPQTAIASTPPGTSSSASATFTFTSSEPGSTFACSLDTAGFTPCTSPQAYSGLGDGAHTFRVEAVDPAGNADSSPATYSWQIVGVGPETIDHTPPGNVRHLQRNVGYGVLKLTWTKPPDGDFDHVRIFVSTSPESPPRTLVYTGKRTRYTNKRFKNGLYYRYSVVSYDHADNASRGAAAVVPPSILLRAPRNGGVVHSPPRLLWGTVAKATFYNVQLYYGSRKVLSAWPNKAKLTLVRRWAYAGRRFQLRKGAYRWYVWPGFGPRSKGHYGQLLGQGTFTVR